MKKLSSAFFLIVLGMISCSKVDENAMIRNPKNEALVQNYLDAIMKADTSSIEGFLADNFMSYGPGTQDSADRATTVAIYKRNWKAWSSLEFDRYVILSNTIKEGRVAGDWVMDWGMLTANYKSKPSIKVRWHGVFKIENGKIVQENVFYDVADILRQHGYTFAPPVDSTKATN